MTSAALHSTHRAWESEPTRPKDSFLTLAATDETSCGDAVRLSQVTRRSAPASANRVSLSATPCVVGPPRHETYARARRLPSLRSFRRSAFSLGLSAMPRMTL